jgi:hypothetical protein
LKILHCFFALGGEALSFLALANASAKKIQAKNPLQPYFRVASAQLLLENRILLMKILLYFA